MLFEIFSSLWVRVLFSPSGTHRWKYFRKILILAFEANSETSQNCTFFQKLEQHCENTKTQYCHDMVKKKSPERALPRLLLRPTWKRGGLRLCTLGMIFLQIVLFQNFFYPGIYISFFRLIEKNECILWYKTTGRNIWIHVFCDVSPVAEICM